MDLLLQALKLFTPLIADAIRLHHAQTGELPTDEQISATLDQNLDTLFGEGRAWKAKKGIPIGGQGVGRTTTDG